MSSFPKVVVATLTWNQKDHVLRCLESLVKLDYPNFEIVVVDNGSVDGTYEAVRARFPGVAIVRHAENLGCAEGVNGEIRYAIRARADYLFIIGNDATVEPSALRELVSAIDAKPQIGLAFPKVYYADSDKKIWFARGAKISEIDWWRGQLRGFIQNVEDKGQYDSPEEANLYPGGFCLVRMAAVHKAGLLDPGYFIYYDDTEWLMRIHRAGYSGRYVPEAKTWHKPGSAFGVESSAFHYYRTRNRLYFFETYSPKGRFLLFFLYFLYDFFWNTLYRLWRSGCPEQARAAILGFVDYLRRKKGSRNLDPSRKKLLGRLAARLLGLGARIPRHFRFWAKRFSGKPVSIKIEVDWNVGDEIMTLPAIEALKKRFPLSRILARFKNSDLLKHHPYLEIDKGDIFDPDLLFPLRGEVRGQSRIESLSRRIGVRELGLPRVYLSPEEIADAGKRWPKNPSRPRIAIARSSARWFSRQWDEARWGELIAAFETSYDAEVLILGKDEIPLPWGINLVDQTSLRQAALLLSQCDLLVGVDSGLVHLALAVGTSTVGLYGPLNPSYLITPRPGFEAVWSDLVCRGCWSDGRMKHPDHCPKVVPDCMKAISVNTVLAASEKFLKNFTTRQLLSSPAR